MKELTQIVYSLKPGEVRFIRRYYKTQSDGEAKKRLELFNMTITHRDITDIDAAEKLYKKKPNSAYSHLKRRLRNDVLNIMMIQSLSMKYDSPSDQAQFECRRLIIEGELLYSRGANIAATKILTNAADLAQLYKLSIEQLLIEDLMRQYVNGKEVHGSAKQYMQNVNQRLKLFEQILTAKDSFHALSIPYSFQLRQRADMRPYANLTYQKLGLIYEKTKSPHIGYWYYKSEISYNLIIRNFVKALNAAKNLLKLIENDISVSSSVKNAEALVHLSYVLLLLKENERALDHAEKAYKIIQLNSIESLYVMECLFYASFNCEEYVIADKVIRKAIKHPRIEESMVVYAKWQYFKANLEFAQANYLQSLHTLNQNNELMRDKTGWLLGHKILEILDLIEMKNYDFVDYKLDSYRKLLQRNGEKVLPRYKCISQILGTLSRENYDFRKMYRKQARNIRILQEGNIDYYRNMLSYEIISFNEWIKKKVDLARLEL